MLSDTSYSVTGEIVTVLGVNKSAPLNTNCVFAENNISFSWNACAYLSKLILVCDIPTSIGAESSNDCVVVLKKLKYSSASENTTESLVRNPSLFLKKKMSLILPSTKEGNGLVLSSPAVLEPQSTTFKVKLVILPVVWSGNSWTGIVSLSMRVSIPVTTPLSVPS